MDARNKSGHDEERAEMPFALHPKLAGDTHLIEDWPLCRVLLMDDKRFPWLILVPRRAGAVEIHDLAAPERALLIEEIARASHALTQLHQPHKINVAALGNAVRQLHVHVVARTLDDAAAGGLVWNEGPAEHYGASEREKEIAALKRIFAK
jgi:diadenosine tetraphosphate (Ap4A) HIT family hydrolase